MARRGYFSHVAPDGSNVGHRAQRAGYDWKRMLENIAAGQPTADEAVEGWIPSDSHRRAMLEPTVTEAGVGYSRSAARRVGKGGGGTGRYRRVPEHSTKKKKKKRKRMH